MQTLLTYPAEEGERELVLLQRPDAPDRFLLLDAAAGPAATDDVVIVDDELTTPAEAGAVATGWAQEHAVATIAVPAPPRAIAPPGEAHELARYRTRSGERIVVAQRVAGTVCVTDRPTGDDGTVLLVQRSVHSRAELVALVADYVTESERRGEPARRVPTGLVDDLAQLLAA
jgi:hypothetical protein